MIIQSLWIGNILSRMEVACINSFLSLGYEYHLYSYSKIENVPKKVKLINANEIINESEIFTYNLPDHMGGKSYSAFSNLFRYKLLYDKGNCWVDTDVYALKRLPETDYILAKESDTKIASCILCFPPKHIFSFICMNKCLERKKDNLRWGETGPLLTSETANKLKLSSFPKSEFFPISFEEIDKFLDDIDLPKSFTIHFWNEMWRRKKIDKNKKFDKRSLYEKLVCAFNLKLL